MNTKIKGLLDRFGWFFPVTLGFLLRLFDLTKSSIWHDEGYTMWLIRYNIPEIIARTARDVHPPAYYLIAKPWTMIFGNSVFSIRFLSLLFSVGIIYLAYKIIEMLVSKRAAFWTGMFIALSPFLIRFGQEARMYGVVAFFTTLATYYFVKFVKEKKNVYLVPYTLAMIVAMYTQYYSFFVIISLWVIFAIYTPEFWKCHWIKGFKESIGIFNFRWWLANIALLVLYLPWFPVAYRQVTRVGGSYWIKPEWITLRTIPGNVSQFLTYTHMDVVYGWHGSLGVLLYWVLILALLGSGLLLYVKKDKRVVASALYIFGYLPMILVFTLSKLKTPIYQDRYFPFSALAILAIWGCVVAMINNKYARVAAGTLVLIAMTFGLAVMHTEVNHQMKQVTDQIKAEKKSGEEVVSGSLYTYLDGSYYFNYQDLKFVSKSVDGFGETSLFYDQADKYIVNPNKLASLGSGVWMLGKPGEDYVTGTPLQYWNVSKVIEKGTVRAVLYTR